ncbi:MAG: ketoacyl-ACP synthase III [Prevotellaceae bacterium]|jgi:3-oxoacyl-[acyl-carrier-protein] synthase-3|nr:ketoacyl-ACP synthase III [Prevotellaceae bacterium]
MFINAIGHYIPKKRVPNDYFLPVNGLTDEWIFQRTGIKTRAWATEHETIDYMCIEAVRRSIAQLPYDISDVDLIVFASYSPSDTVATTAHIVQREFQITSAKAFYLSSACSSAMNAMEIIQLFFSGGRASKALLLSADRNTSYYNPQDPKAGHLWGDAATAFFFSKERAGSAEPYMVDIVTHGLGHVGKGKEGVYLDPKKEGIQMHNGKDVFTQACTYIARCAEEVTGQNGYSIADLTYFIAHQANMRIVNHVIKQLGIPEEKSLTNISELGNTGSVSSMLIFAQSYDRFHFSCFYKYFFRISFFRVEASSIIFCTSAIRTSIFSISATIFCCSEREGSGIDKEDNNV